MKKSVSFSGICSGDGECFCFAAVPEEDLVTIKGEERHERDKAEMRRFAKMLGESEVPIDLLYPYHVFKHLGVHDSDRPFKITIIVEHE